MIAIGDGAFAYKRNEFVIRVTGYTLSTVLTEEEHDFLSKIVNRMDVVEDTPKETI